MTPQCNSATLRQSKTNFSGGKAAANDLSNQTWQNFIQTKLEKKQIFGKSGFINRHIVDEDEDSVESSSVEISDSQGSAKGLIQKARPYLAAQEDLIVICTTENDNEIRPDRPVSFPDLDYRLDVKCELFSEREI